MSRITDIAKTMKTWWDEDDNPLVHLALNEIIRIDQEQLPTIEPKRGKADRPQGWIPCSERLPKIRERVLLATNGGIVFIGHRDKPDLIWQVTEEDGRKHWVYDPEAYTDDVDILPKAEDCGFSQDSDYSDGFLSVTSVNYDKRFSGVVAWMPLPEPWRGEQDE